eukprot:2209667-Prymnesium_polylepis.1
MNCSTCTCACLSRQCANMPWGLLGSGPGYRKKKTGTGLSGHAGHCSIVFVQGFGLVKCEAIFNEKMNCPTALHCREQQSARAHCPNQ